MARSSGARRSSGGRLWRRRHRHLRQSRFGPRNLSTRSRASQSAV
jgi:hypothetical protein